MPTQPDGARRATVVTLGRLGFVGPRGAEAERLLSQPKRVDIVSMQVRPLKQLI